MKSLIESIKNFSARRHAQKVVKLYEQYEHWLGPAAMLVGVTVDFLAFRRIDLLFENLVLVGYLLIGIGGIMLVNLYEGGVVKGKIFDRLRLWLPLVIQYALGGLLSAFMVFYLRSASVATSWPFFLILLGLIVGNELFRIHYLKLTFHMSVYFFALYSYAVFVLPIVLRQMGPWVFVLSGVVSILLIWLLVYCLSKAVPQRIQEARRPLLWGIGFVVVMINLLYFTKIIPPIPLALKEAGVFHSVARVGNEYQAVSEEKKWYQMLRRDTIHVSQSELVYVFSAVFAPTHLDISVTHHWQYKNKETKTWMTADRITYPVVGGRDGGYRGYSFKRTVFPGEWRVDVETSRGQIIGRVRFEVKEVSQPPVFERKVF